MATLTRRERLRADTIAEIKQAARHQIATHGPASLSLGIARDIGVARPGCTATATASTP